MTHSTWLHKVWPLSKCPAHLWDHQEPASISPTVLPAHHLLSASGMLPFGPSACLSVFLLHVETGFSVSFVIVTCIPSPFPEAHCVIRMVKSRPQLFEKPYQNSEMGKKKRNQTHSGDVRTARTRR